MYRGDAGSGTAEVQQCTDDASEYPSSRCLYLAGGLVANLQPRDRVWYLEPRAPYPVPAPKPRTCQVQPSPSSIREFPPKGAGSLSSCPTLLRKHHLALSTVFSCRARLDLDAPRPSAIRQGACLGIRPIPESISISRRQPTGLACIHRERGIGPKSPERGLSISQHWVDDETKTIADSRACSFLNIGSGLSSPFCNRH
jgi:hypothetical protein